MKDINKMSDEELFKFLDEEAVRIREQYVIRPTPPRRNKLYKIATDEMSKKIDSMSNNEIMELATLLKIN